MSEEGEDSPSLNGEVNEMSGKEDSGDEFFQLVQKALFVQHPTRPIDLDTIPCDGSEYIHKSRLEDANLFLTPSIGVAPEENEQKRMRQMARRAAEDFKNYAFALSSNKAKIYLRKKFPRKLKFPGNGPAGVQDWCVFCLGSKLCSKIYGENYEKPSKDIEGNLPLMSIMCRFNQFTAFTVLKHLHAWFFTLGMVEQLGVWVYAVLACIRKPLDESSQDLVETFFHDCEKRLKDCDESERRRLYLISAIIESYFCIHSDKVGPTLENFSNLKI